MSATKIIKAFAKKSLTKDKGSGITSLPSEFIAAEKAAQIELLLSRAGIPLEQLDDYIRTEADLLKFLNIIEATSKPKVYSGQAAADQLNKLFPKKGEVVDMSGKKLDPGKPIMGGTQDDTVTGIMTQIDDRMTGINKANKKLGELLEEREIMYGKAPKTKDNPKVQQREMFKDASERFNKTDVIADTVTKIISMEPVAALKEANKVIGRKGVYKNLTEEQSKKILKDSEDWIFQRDPSDLYDYNKNRPFRDDPNFDPDDPDYQDYVKNRDRDDYYTGGMVDVEPSLSDIGHGSDALMARTRLMSPGAQATTSTGLNYLLAEDNDNIRVPFAGGKSFSESELLEFNKAIKEKIKKGGRSNMPVIDPEEYKKYLESFKTTKAAEGGRIGFQGGGMGRRAFLKLLAALGGGIAGIKTGILGLGGKETGKQVAKEVVKSAGSGQPPPYFFKLVEKIKTLGDDTLATQDNAIAKKYKDYVMEEDFAGNISIMKKNMDDPYPEEVIMSYKVDEVDLPSGKGMAKVDEYEEFTVRPDAEGKMKDIEPGVPDEVVNEGSVFEDNMTEFGKAEGGRIGFSGGGGLYNVLARLGITGSSRRFLEKTFGKENFENMIRNDPDMHRGLLEVVEMFRNRDKEGLKMYMQKFLPHMDDAEIEDFIIGGEGTEGIQGQLIRLGSGRDYAQKLKMIEKAENMRKLDKLELTDDIKRKPNAEGGRASYASGGITALKSLINYFAKQAGRKGSDQLRDINPKVLDSGIANIMGPEHMNMLKKNQTEYLESLLNIIKSDKKFLDQNKKLAETMMKDAPEGFEDQAQGIVKMMIESTMGKGGRLDRLKVYDKINIDDAIVDVEQMIKNRRVKESDGRVLNASGGLQAMLGE
jgi:hypothetical protein